ncbi:MAG: insulinase family protein [Alphaproteobacteria bacterium]|nr:insulinase family protein [Alphaproteobacteria bacterium]
MAEIQTTTLSNGLRIITDTVPSVHSVALGIWAGVGSRNEQAAHNGVAHMVEHMLFKGTKNRNALELAEVIENVGGHMNAYTSREVTSYHIHLLKDDMSLALNVLSDMYQHSTLPKDEIERERQVILQEIGMCHDTPDDLIFDNYYETAYPEQALGAPILGTNEIVSRMSKETLQNHITQFYTPSRTVISAAGNLNHDEFVDLVSTFFNDFPSDKNHQQKQAYYHGGEYRTEKSLEQSHFILGFQGLSRLDSNYYEAQALSILFGGGMSSRLFQEIREKRGLVYSIFSFHSASIDNGQFGIYAGTSPEKLDEIIPVVCDEVQKLSSTITEKELKRARIQLKTGMLMGRESMMARADQQAKHMLFHGKTINLDELITKIDAINEHVVSQIAQKIFATTPTLAALGSLNKLEEYESITQRLAA